MVEKIKTEVDRLFLVLIIKKKISMDFVKLDFFSFFKPKVIYVRFYLLYHFPNFENKILFILDTNMYKFKINKIFKFLKYHMPLKAMDQVSTRHQTK